MAKMVKLYVYILSVIDFLSLAFLLPVQSRRMMRLGGDRFYLGILQSSQSLLQFLGGPLIGSWSDNVGSKRALFLCCNGLLLSYILFSGPWLGLYVIARLLNATCGHIQILIRGILTENKVADAKDMIGKMRAFGAASFMIGPIIGGYIASYGFEYLCLSLSMLSIISIIISYLLPKSPQGKKEAAKTKETNTLKSILGNFTKVDWSIYWDLFLLRFLVEMYCGIHHVNMGYVFSSVFQIADHHVGYIVAFYGLMSVIAQTQVKRLKACMERPLVVGTMGFLVMFVILLFLQDFYTYIAMVAPFAILKTVLEATWTENLIDRSLINENKNQGAVTGGFESLMKLAGFISPVLNGYVSQQYGQASSYAMCSAIGVLAVTLTLLKSDKKQKKL